VSILEDDKPAGVSARSLVLDAVARLPSGYGAKSEVIQSLQLSRYVKKDAHEKAFQNGEGGS